MKRTLLAATVLLSVLSSQAEIVYNNSVTDLSTRFRVDNGTVGDEIVLGGTGRQLTTMSFQYYGLSLSGNETARLVLYRNDGAPLGGSGNTFLPSGIVYDSGPFSIAATDRATLNFDLTLDNITLPNQFTWAVEFAGVEGGENVGLDLYNPPTVGSSFNDYWFLNAGNWELRTNALGPINFAAQFNAVPEPSTWALAVMGGLSGFFFLRRRKTN